MTSIFSKIIAREIPGEILYEDSLTIAFLDIAPKTEGHTLVVPKIEVPNFDQLPVESATALITTIHKVVKGVVSAMETPQYNLVLNNGPAAGQVVFHVHFHIIPRYVGDPRGRLGQYAPGRMAKVAQLIRDSLAQ